MGRSAAANGQGLEAAHPMSRASTQTSNGLATVIIRPKNKMATNPMTATAAPPRRSEAPACLLATTHVTTARTSPERIIEPSRAAQAVATSKGNGVADE